MNETIKDKPFYEVQKYIATKEWKTLKLDFEATIVEIEESLIK